MIRELLTADKIVSGLVGNYSSALDTLLERTSFPEMKEELKNAFSPENPVPISYISGDVAIPHVRIEGLAKTEILLGISKNGVMIDGRRLHIILFLATPAGETGTLLRLLQGLSSLIPSVSNELLNAERPEDSLEILTRGEERAKPSYINLTDRQVAFELQTDLEKGLTEDEAKRRAAHYGGNLLKKQIRIPWYVMLVRNFFSLFAVLLWAAAGLCYVPGVNMPELGFAIIIVVLLNGFFSFLQEYRSDRAVEALAKLIAYSCRVVRDGEERVIDSSSLVPGDVIVLNEGDVVPADSRLIEAFEVEVDNSSLTGESTSSKRYKSNRPVLIEGKFLWIELPNIVFAGSSLIRGSAKAVVFGTGMDTEIGKIAGMTQAISAEDSPLQKQLRGTVIAIAILAFSLGLVFLFLGWLVAGLSFIQAFVFFIGLFVANVPEGLLPTVTLSLAMGVMRMAKRNAVIKNLSSVETLGCTTVICCDKTGTLTQNLMMVTTVHVDGQTVHVKGAGYEPTGEFYVDDKRLDYGEIAHWSAFRRLLECAYICNNSRLEKTGQAYTVLGDPTEGALSVLASRANLRGTHHRIHLNPFESVRKRMSVVVKLEGRKERTAYVKGGPLEILERSRYVYRNGEIVPLGEEEKIEIRNRTDEMAVSGLRVLALAYLEDRDLEGRSEYGIEDVERDLVFLGLTGMSDPVRPAVPDAIHSCHTAGIRVMMITGDYVLTAEKIAREIGMGKDGLVVRTGSEIEAQSETALTDILRKGECVFARVSPEQKLRIVSLLKKMGEVVAVTGDGVNDGPALKKADIGIAMGIRGTDVAKEAAQVILTDDNFASIVAAVEEGRAIFENIKRFVSYIFNSNPQEMYPYIFWMLFPNVPLAMTVMGVLAVDVGTDLIPAMGLGIEPPEKGIMERPPRKKEEKLLSLKLILRSYFVQGSILAASCYATYYYFSWAVMGSLTAPPASPVGLDMKLASFAYLQSLTAYFFPTVTTQAANVMCKRSYRISLFSKEFLSDTYRSAILNALREWRPKKYVMKIRMDYEIASLSQIELMSAFYALSLAFLLFPFRLLRMGLSSILLSVERPLLRPLLIRLSGFLERHYILFNLFSNPLINTGILFEFFLCYLFFYSDLSKIYFFAPVPWHVYLFAFHGMFLLFFFEELKKYFRRRGHEISFLG